MESMRFYYADAAVEQALMHHANCESGARTLQPEFKLVFVAVGSLLKEYVEPQAGTS